jgi:hypothetical protein
MKQGSRFFNWSHVVLLVYYLFPPLLSQLLVFVYDAWMVDFIFFFFLSTDIPVSTQGLQYYYMSLSPLILHSIAACCRSPFSQINLCQHCSKYSSNAMYVRCYCIWRNFFFTDVWLWIFLKLQISGDLHFLWKFPYRSGSSPALDRSLSHMESSDK